MQRNFDAVIRTTADDTRVAETFLHIQTMRTSPARLFQLSSAYRVWRHKPHAAAQRGMTYQPARTEAWRHDV